jgi:ABC-type transport system involved in cytochrome bd biosynthesis fused ATPase/permease subunit
MTKPFQMVLKYKTIDMRPSAMQMLRIEIAATALLGLAAAVALGAVALWAGCLGVVFSDFGDCFFAMALITFYYVKSI